MRGGEGQGLDGGLLGPDVGHMLQLGGVGHVKAGPVLGQDLHEGAELQPPLLLRDPMSATLNTCLKY